MKFLYIIMRNKRTGENMIIFQREMKRNLKLLIIWTIVIGGLMILTLAMFPEVAKQQQTIDKLMKQMPPSLIKAFGMDKVNMSDALGYYATKGYLMITLFGSIFAVMLAGNILSKEHSEKTIEFLLSKPVSRSRIVTEKLLAVVVNIFLFNLMVAAANYLVFRMVDASFSLKLFAFLTAAPVFLHLVFAGISFFLSSLMKKGRSVVAISLGLVFILYFFELISSIADKYEPLKYFTPFVYVNAADIISREGLDPMYTGIMAAEIIISILASYIIFAKKDI